MSHNCKIIYINLKKRTDRREEIEQELTNFNLQFERFEAFETPGFGILGCGLSHLGVLKLAKERNYENVLILEDDFTFIVSKEEFEKNLTELFSSNINFDVCKLAYGVHFTQDVNNDYVCKTTRSQSASAYIVRKHYYDTLIELYEWATPLLETTKEHWNYANDLVWYRLQEKDNWYYFKTRLGKQRAGYSDNCEAYRDYNF